MMMMIHTLTPRLDDMQGSTIYILYVHSESIVESFQVAASGT